MQVRKWKEGVWFAIKIFMSLYKNLVGRHEVKKKHAPQIQTNHVRLPRHYSRHANSCTCAPMIWMQNKEYNNSDFRRAMFALVSWMWGLCEGGAWNFMMVRRHMRSNSIWGIKTLYFTTQKRNLSVSSAWMTVGLDWNEEMLNTKRHSQHVRQQETDEGSRVRLLHISISYGSMASRQARPNLRVASLVQHAFGGKRSALHINQNWIGIKTRLVFVQLFNFDRDMLFENLKWEFTFIYMLNM